MANRKRRQRTEARLTDSTPATARLSVWQDANYHGYTIAEKRLDRRQIVTSLLSKVREQNLDLKVAVLAADDISCAQWKRFLEKYSSENWIVVTPSALLADGGEAGSNYVLIIDEAEAYTVEELAPALAGAVATLGLCSSHRGLGGAVQLRKLIGRSLDRSHRGGRSFDVHQLAAHCTFSGNRGDGNKIVLDDDDLPEQLPKASEQHDALRYYLKEVGRFPLLKAEQEIDLAKQIEAGLYATRIVEDVTEKRLRLSAAQRRYLSIISLEGAAAKAQFITSNLRLVISIARRYQSRIELLDAIQEGNLGLLRAVEKFDYTKGYKFSTYATWWIRQAITRAIADQTNVIRIPVHQFESDKPILDEWRRQISEGGFPTPRDIANTMHISAHEVEAALGRHRHPLSLEELAEERFDIKDPDEHLIPHEALMFSMIRDRLQEVLKRLDEREADVIRLRFGLVDGRTRTLEEIGATYSLSRERIRQIEAKAHSKLYEVRRFLRPYLEFFDDAVLI
ncbi:sigma-70 family RNA polymerase sigma factor [Mycolicibacterium elephantis]|uniref:sigma-70 family RNA polymerase sigma factor n=1 Tax=Mycolicibacterium elephantis TaxID=81858 RepID=UPI001041E199|nr:sigma-70 family RNA polymerase sigma factor [Mycolicibacterium elephantis]